jgi:hypothetical protein
LNSRFVGGGEVEDFIWANKIFPNTPKYASFAFTKTNSLRKIFSKISACLKII